MPKFGIVPWLSVEIGKDHGGSVPGLPGEIGSVPGFPGEIEQDHGGSVPGLPGEIGQDHGGSVRNLGVFVVDLVIQHFH